MTRGRRDHTGDLVAGLCVIAAACAACAYYVIARVCLRLLMWVLSLPVRAARAAMRSLQEPLDDQAQYKPTTAPKRINPAAHKVETRDVVAGTVHTLKDRKGRKLASVLIGTDGIPQREIIHKDSQEVQQWLDDVVRKQCRASKRKTKRRARSPRKVL